MRAVLCLGFAAVVAALAVPLQSASAFCPACACAGPCPPPAPVLIAPQPSFHVEQGPSYHAVIIAEDEVEPRLKFAHPHAFPYIRGRTAGAAAPW